LRKLLFACLAVIMTGLIAGCGNLNRVPRYDIGEPLEIQPFKRQTLNQSRDYIKVWRKPAYSKVTEPLRRHLSDDMVGVLERHGQPDYLRSGWRSTSNEIVDEWVYWDRSVIVQYVQDQLVYEGPLTDMDRYRVRYGYPRRAWSQVAEAGVQRDFWDYQGFLLDTSGMIVSFSNESLVSENKY
jgi:hypothetical protein